MTDLTTDGFDAVRRGLLAATTRDRARRARRARFATIAAATGASLVLLTGIAAAANERVATAISRAADSLFNSVDGAGSNETPSATAQRQLADIELGHGGRPSHPVGRVLLHQEIAGVDVEIVAVKRPQGSPSRYGASKHSELCVAVVTTPQSSGGGSTMCTTELIPGMPSNYSSGWNIGPDGSIEGVTIAGVTTDSVASVTIVTKDGDQKAAMGDDAFYWHGSHVTPTAIEMTLHDGTVKRAGISFPDVGR